MAMDMSEHAHASGREMMEPHSRLDREGDGLARGGIDEPIELCNWLSGSHCGTLTAVAASRIRSI